MSTNEPSPSLPGGAPAAPYSAVQAWSYGWRKLRENLGQIVLAVAVLVALQLGAQAVNYVAEDSWLLRGIASFVGWMFTLIIGAGIVRASLDVTDGREFEMATVFGSYKLGPVVLVSVITSILVVFGLVLCIVPGLLAAFYTAYSLYFLMDREEVSAGGSIWASASLVQTNFGNVLVWFVLSLATYLGGFLLCGVGLLLAIPIIVIGTAYTYKTLTGQPVAP